MQNLCRVGAPGATWKLRWFTTRSSFILLLMVLFSSSVVLGSPQNLRGLGHRSYLGELGAKKTGLGTASLMWPQQSGGIVEEDEEDPVLKGGAVEEESDTLLRNRRADDPSAGVPVEPSDDESGSAGDDEEKDPSSADTEAPPANTEVPPPDTEAPPPETEAPPPNTEAPPASTEAPPPATDPPTDPPTTGPPSAENATSPATTAAPPPTASGLFSNANMSTIYDKNYSYIDQTNFVSGMNGWDFEGIWLKSNLESMTEDDRPVPMPHPPTSVRVEGGSNVGGALEGTGEGAAGAGMSQQILSNSTNGTTPGYVNNYVIIDYSFLAGGVLRKVFPAMNICEVFLSYYVIEDTTNFRLSLESPALQQPQVLYTDATSSPRPTGQWVVRNFNFTANFSLDFALVLTVDPPTTPAGDRKPLLAVHHISVGGNLSDPSIIQPPAGSNETIIPPGAMEPIQEIATAIWTALYVFLAFFLASIAALIFLIVRGRRSQTESVSRTSDYNPDTSYRLDKVYDNPSYDASSP